MTKTELRAYANKHGLTLSEARERVNQEQHGGKKKVAGQEYQVFKTILGDANLASKMAYIIAVGEGTQLGFWVNNDGLKQSTSSIEIDELIATIGVGLARPPMGPDAEKRLTLAVCDYVSRTQSVKTLYDTDMNGMVVSFFTADDGRTVARPTGAFYAADLMEYVESIGNWQLGETGFALSCIKQNPNYLKDEYKPTSMYYQMMRNAA